MVRLPNPGQDDGVWGTLLNDYLTVEHNADGSLKIRTDGTVAMLTANKVPTANLGSGSASASNFLRGDGTWAIPSASATDTNAVHKGDLTINVKDYGATGNGSTNDASAVQAAITAAATTGTGNTVFFPAGMYRIGSRITVPAGTVLRGVSAGSYPDNNTLKQVSVLARTAGMNDHVLYMPDGNNQVHISDLAIDGNKNNNTAGCGIYIADGASGQESQAIIERCYIHDNPDSNIYLGNNRRANKIIRCVTNYSLNADGITVAGSDNTIESCIVGSNARAGVAVGSTATQQYTVSGGYAASVTHISNCDMYNNLVGIAVAQYSSDTMLTNNGIDRNLRSGVTVYDGASTSIVGNAFHSNGTSTDNTYAHIDIASGATATAVDNNIFGPIDGGVTNRASYAISVPATTNRILGNIGTLDSSSTASGITNASANAQPWVTLSNAGATIQSSGNDILNLKNTGGTTVTKLTNGGSFVHSGGGVQFSVNSNHVFGATAPIGTSANLLSLKTTSAAIANLATQNTASQTAANIISYAADGTTVLFQVDKGGAASVTGMTGATAASRYAGGTASGAPASGTFAIGDFIIDQTGKIWICTVAGTPGTWTAGGGITVDNSTLPQADAITATAGNSGNAAPQNHAHPRTYWTPSDHGLLTWSMDVTVASANSIVGAAGTLYLALVHVPVAGSATNILAAVTSSTATLTSGQCFASLYTAAGVLVGSTADQSTAWTTSGLKTMALAGGPYALTAGNYYIGFYVNGSVLPNFARGNNQIGGAFLNAGLSSNYRFATANTGLTTTPVSNLGALTSSNMSWWLAIS